MNNVFKFRQTKKEKMISVQLPEGRKLYLTELGNIPFAMLHSHDDYSDFVNLVLWGLMKLNRESPIKNGKLKYSFAQNSGTAANGFYEAEIVVDFDSEGVPCVRVARTPINHF